MLFIGFLSLVLLSSLFFWVISSTLMASFTTYMPVTPSLALVQSLPSCPTDTSNLKSLLFSYSHPQLLFYPHLTFPGHLFSHQALPWNICPFHLLCHFFIVSCLCHLIYCLSSSLLFPSLFHIPTWVIILKSNFVVLLLIWCARPLTVYSQVASWPEALHFSFAWISCNTWIFCHSLGVPWPFVCLCACSFCLDFLIIC